MHFKFRLGFGFAVLVLAAGITPPTVSAEHSQSAAQAVTASSLDLSQLLAPLHDGQWKPAGSLSCSATACHGSMLPRAGEIRRGHEYLVWFEEDPHSLAYQTLSSGRSAAMMQRLGIIKDGDGYHICLACHSPTATSKTLATDENAWTDGETYGRSFRQGQRPAPSESGAWASEGVSCEACHGPAEKWRAEHYRRDWNLRSARAAGTIDTKNLLVRARLCADCHVGSRHREVNHDLIAAGHPALKFELAAYMALLPKHWDDRRERSATPNFELKLWAAGQVASADAALDLLEARAARASTDHPQAKWPEFAEYDCSSCHHSLSLPSWRQQRGFQDRRADQLPWGNWYFTMLEQFGRQPKSGAAMERVATSLSELRTYMQSGLAPDAAMVHGRAAAARNSLSQFVAVPGFLDVLDLRRKNPRLGDQPQIVNPEHILSILSADGQPIDGNRDALANWDVATQLYLTLVALNISAQSGGQPISVAVPGLLNQIRDDLRVPANYENEPLRSQRVRSRLNQILTQLDQRLDR